MKRKQKNGPPVDLIPQARLSGPMPWVIAIMVALTVIAAAAGMALRNSVATARDGLSGGVTIQVIEASPEFRQRQAEAVLARLRDMPDVVAIRPVPSNEVEDLIEPWLGADAGGAEGVPVPALIDAQLSGTLHADRIGSLQADLQQIAPGARVDAQSSWLKPVFDAIRSLQWLALALVALLALAMAAAVLLATRTALGTHRDTIEVIHMLGGTDAQVAAIFQRSVGLDAAGGGAVGLALGAVVVLFLGRQFDGLGAGLADSGALGWLDWVVLALIPLAGVALAMLTARLSVLRALRTML